MREACPASARTVLGFSALVAEQHDGLRVHGAVSGQRLDERLQEAIELRNTKHTLSKTVGG